MRFPWFRLAGIILLGNILGYAAWLGARMSIPLLWQGQGPKTNFLMLMGLTALTGILLAAPPVLVGALGGWLARRAQPLVGQVCGLWSFTLVGRVPSAFPIAAGVWYVPTVLVLLSGALGGWMMDLRASAENHWTAEQAQKS
jgi:hypothetical protein